MKILSICLGTFLIFSCNVIEPINFLEESVIVDYKAQEVRLMTDNTFFKIQCDWLNVTGCTGPIYTEDTDYFEGEWFKARIDSLDRKVIIVELTENNTGEERHMNVHVSTGPSGTSATVTQLPKKEE